MNESKGLIGESPECQALQRSLGLHNYPMTMEGAMEWYYHPTRRSSS